MKILNKTKCLVIGPMENSNGRNVREYISERLGKINIDVWNHYEKPFITNIKEDEETHQKLIEWRNNGEYEKIASYKEIRAMDLSLVDRADFIICIFNEKVLTAGTWEELYLGNRHKKPIFFVSINGKDKVPFWIFWTLPIKYIYGSLEEALQMIENIDAGKVEIDSSRWKLLKEDLR